MNQAELTKQILSRLDRKPGCVILIKGGWGTGKTHYWRECLEQEIQKTNVDRRTAYVSLFGKNNIDSIQQEILVQLFSRNKHIANVRSALASLKTTLGFDGESGGAINLGVTGNVLSMALSLMEKGSFSNVVLCVDDFERKADSLKCSEIVGYASVLAERNKCSIIMLMDEDKIDKAEYADYEKYKEKFVDREYVFSVDQGGAIGKMLSVLSDRQRNGVRNGIKAAQIANLRVLQKSVLEIQEISDALCLEKESDIAEYVAFHITCLECVYSLFGANGLSRLTDYARKIMKGEPVEDGLLGIYNSRLASIISTYIPIDQQLWACIKGGPFDFKLLADLIEKFNSEQVERRFKDTVFEQLNEYMYDTRIGSDVFVSNMKALLGDSPRNFVSICVLTNFNYLIRSMKEISGDNAYWDSYSTQQYTEYVKHFFDFNGNLQDYSVNFRHSEIQTVIDGSDVAKAEHDRLYADLVNNSRDFVDTIGIMQSVVVNRGWSEYHEKCLNGIPQDLVTRGILENKDFFEAVLDFSRWAAGFGNSNPFAEFQSKVSTSINSLGVKRLGAFRYNRALELGRLPQNT